MVSGEASNVRSERRCQVLRQNKLAVGFMNETQKNGIVKGKKLRFCVAGESSFFCVGEVWQLL